MRYCNSCRQSCCTRALVTASTPEVHGCGISAPRHYAWRYPACCGWRNGYTRVSFLYLEFEDWFVVMGLAALTNIFGRWIDRHMFGIPMNVFLQYIVPVLSIPFLMLFKYGKPGGYLKDFLAWHAKPRIYCGLEPDSGMKLDYFKEEEIDANDYRTT